MVIHSNFQKEIPKMRSDNSLLLISLILKEEKMEERTVRPFTMWRHFKGARSFVITDAQQKYRFEEITE